MKTHTSFFRTAVTCPIGRNRFHIPLEGRAFNERVVLGEDLVPAGSILTSDNTAWSNRLLVGLRLQTGNFSGAQTALDALPSSTQSDLEYKYCQHINLNRLQDANFAMTTTQEDDLYAIANGATPEASYARALITILTGVVFPPEMPETLEERSNQNQFSEFG